MKDSIKRAQSRAGSGFAERENFRPKVKQQKTKQLIMTLVALLALTTHAWATDPTVYDSGDIELSSLQEGDILMPGVNLTNVNNSVTPYLYLNRFSIDGVIQTGMPSISSNPFSIGLNGLISAKLAGNNGPFDCMPITEDGKAGNAWVVTYIYTSPFNSNVKDIHIGGTTYTKPTPFAITWSAATPNTASIDKMPAGNVTVNVEYFPQAELAKSTGETPEPLAPTAIAGVLANTDAPIVTPGTVANIGTSEVKQGTLMYYASQTEMTDDDLLALDADKWRADVPTAANLLEGAAYVYYYIQGAEPAQGTERTDANTCSDGDILAANVVNVTVLSNKFDLTLNPANVNTIDATDASKGTVTVKEGTGAAVDKTGDITADGKLKAVKMDSEVKLKANNGYKFRKVEVKKDKKTLTITNGEEFTITLDITGCTTWDEVIDKNSDMIIKSDTGIYYINYQYWLYKGGVPVKADDPFDPNATDYQWATQA